ncbi:hypothetical protein LSUE1_G008202, partial [Lachnellula suecica]
MKLSSASLALGGLAAANATNSTFHDQLAPRSLKRAYLTCEQTYGGGSTTCGDPSTSHFCYDPTIGDTCCLLDDGYCKIGDFCAPVTGYCCHDTEDPATCATRLGFALPSSSSSAAASSSASIPTSSSSTPPSPSTSTIAIAILSAPVVVSSAAPSDLPSATEIATSAAATTASGMTPEFTAPLNQTAGNSSAGANSSVPTNEFTGAGDGRGVAVGV